MVRTEELLTWDSAAPAESFWTMGLHVGSYVGYSVQFLLL